MKNRIWAFVGAVCILSTLMIGTAFAGGWRMGSKGWWYDLDNGQYYSNGWQWIDGNGDGQAECYYFDQSGWMLSNTITPDSFIVDVNGAWTVSGTVQTKQVQLTNVGQQNQTNGNGEFLNLEGIDDPTGAYDEDNTAVIRTRKGGLFIMVQKGDGDAYIYPKTRIDKNKYYSIFDSNTIVEFNGKNLTMSSIDPQNRWSHTWTWQRRDLNGIIDSKEIADYWGLVLENGQYIYVD